MKNSNWKCKICGHVCGQRNGILTHVREKHGQTNANMDQVLETKESVTNPAKYKAQKTRQARKNKHNFKCKVCGWVNASKEGFVSHFRKAHPGKSTVNCFSLTEEQPNNAPGMCRKVMSRPVFTEQEPVKILIQSRVPLDVQVIQVNL